MCWSTFDPSTSTASTHIYGPLTTVSFGIFLNPIFSIPPTAFIPMAEELGLIHELGAFMLERTAEAYRDWAHRVPGLRLSVNVSGRQLQNRSFAERLLQLADESGVDARALTLELTDSVLLDDPDSTIRGLDRLREAGYRLAEDDFRPGS